MRRSLGFLVVLSTLGLLGASRARADVHPNTAGGFPVNGAFNAGDVDSVNLFNGSLGLSIPIGTPYPLATDFAYRLKLSYNSNPWMFQTVTHNLPPDNREVNRTAGFPNPCSNAGLGWRVSLGRMDPPCQVPDANGQLPGPIYQDESGADHVFYNTLHAGDPEDAPVAGVSNMMYTRDGSYLRLKVLAGNVREVEFPDASVKRFDSTGRITQIRDAFGNNLGISYATANQWVLTDSQGRTHRVIFRTDLPSYPQTVDRIELANPTGVPAVYQFNYQNSQVGRGCPHNDNNDPTSIGPNVLVPLLTSVTLPDTSQWKAAATDYITALATTTGCTEGGGNITALNLPTLGRMEWTYQTYYFPVGSTQRRHTQRNSGVATRAMRNPGGGLLGVWTYTTPTLGTVLASKDLVNSVTDPLGNKRVNYFSTALDGALTGWSKYEYSLPFTRNSTLNVAPGVDLNLSSQTFNPGGTLLRSEYVLYERDVVSGFDAPDIYNSNRRLARSRNVYHDDGGTVSGLINTEFDGLGHYRASQTEGSFAAGTNVQTKYDHYNPARGTYSINAAADTANPGFTMLPSNAAWALGTMDFNWDSENGATAFRATCYAPGTTKLTRLRTYRLDAAAQGTLDLVTVYDLAGGNVVAEKYYGGDQQGGIPNATGDNCTMALPAAPEYQINHTYSGGVRATSQYSGTTFLTLDRLIDPSSGLTTYERDASNIGTAYEYDSMGRVTWSKPDAGHGSWTQYLYNVANPTTLANANVFRRHRDNGSKSATILTTSQTTVDGFGRLYRDERRLPDGTLAKRETLYDNAGNRASVSEWVTSNFAKKTSYLNYDAFGRPTTIRPPDGAAHDVTFLYRGVRQIERTTQVATSAGGAEVPATTTETYDRVGRLLQVTEPSGTSGANVTTTYGYDVGSRLSSVSTTAGVPGSGNVTQTRTFNHDRAGLLTSEVQPEKGTNGNGSVSYPRYDARGNLLRIVDGPNDLTYFYDAGERLYRVRETNGAQRTLKTFTYAGNNGTFTDPSTGLSCTDNRKNKVTAQSRFNYVTVNGGAFAVEMREGMTYCGREGKESRRTLESYVNGAATPSESFVFPNRTYSSFGELTSLAYPQCTHAACTAPLPRTVSFGYTDMLLTSVGVPGNAGYYASSISYHPNLMVNQVVHTNNPADLSKNLTDSYVNDPNAMPRPASIAVTTNGGVTRWTSGAYAYDGGGNVKAIGSSTFAYDRVHRLTASNQYLEPITPATLRSQTFSYDAFGNLLAVGGTGARSTPTTPGINRLAGGTYDAAGNLKTWNGNLYEYGPFDRMWRYKTATDEWVYLYTADDERVWSYKLDNTSLWTLRDPATKSVLREYRNNSTWSLGGDYVYRGDAQLAQETPTGTLQLHLDHLGSPRLVSDSLGNQRSFHVYFPYGDEATVFNQDTIRAKFTGHERDLGNLAGAGDDLDFMHARFYNPLTGRFHSYDAGLADPRIPQSWNRYAYVMGNPIKYVDPDGELPGFSGTITVYANDSSSIFFGSLTAADSLFLGGLSFRALLAAAAEANPVGAVIGAGALGYGVGTLINQIPGVSETITAGFEKALEHTYLSEGGGGKTGRKASKDAIENGRRVVEDVRRRLADLRAKPNKKPEDHDLIDRIKRELKKAIDNLRKSEEHARQAQR